MARSALRRRWSAPSTSPSMRAMPILPLTCSSRPLTTNGWRRPSSTRSATWTTSTSSLASSMSTANSSPPKRATVSLGRTQDRSRSATWISSRSPAAWPQAVVDLLEPVQVDEQHRHRRGLALGPLEGVVDPVLEQGPVGQRGQRVVERLVDQLVLELAALGDVAGVEDQPADAGVVEQVGDGDLGRAPVPVAVAQGQLQLQDPVGAFGDLG